MSDDDLIRRGDALAIVVRDRVPTNRTGSEFRVVSTQDMLKAIAALEPVTAPDPASIREATLREATEMVSKEATTAREVFEDYGSKAKEAVDYMEQLLLADIRAALKGDSHD